MLIKIKNLQSDLENYNSVVGCVNYSIIVQRLNERVEKIILATVSCS